VRLTAERKLDFAAQVVWVRGIRSDEPDKLVGVIMAVLHEDWVALGHGIVPGGVHLERTRHHLAVDPHDAVGELVVNLLEIERHVGRTQRVLHEVRRILTGFVVQDGHRYPLSHFIA